jgi:hypothetical protein
MKPMGTIAAALALVQAAGSVQATNAQATSQKTVSQILARAAQNIKGLTSYQVQFHADAHVRRSIFSAKVPLDGTKYYKEPDKAALKIPNVPPQAKDFTNVLGWLGTPETWESTYDVTLQPTSSIGVYELRATYKPNSRTHVLLDKVAGSSLDYVVLDLDSKTYDPVRVRWLYKNKSEIEMDITSGTVAGGYRLPVRETVDMNIPKQQVKALITYGTYYTNVQIPDSTFSKS